MIPEIEELYQEGILDHSRRPRNFGELPDAAVRVHGDNPACGDEIHLAVKFDPAGGLEDIKFTGHGCAISQASAIDDDEIERQKPRGSDGNASRISRSCDKGDKRVTENPRRSAGDARR